MHAVGRYRVFSVSFAVNSAAGPASSRAIRRLPPRAASSRAAARADDYETAHA